MVKVLDVRPSVLLRARREEVLAVAARFGITQVRVFGSVARGDDDENSDIDLLVSFEPGTMSMGDLVEFEDELTSLLGIPVDLVSSAARRVETVERHAIAL